MMYLPSTLSSPSKTLQGIHDHVSDALHNVGVRGGLAVEIGFHIHLLFVVILLDHKRDLCAYLIINHLFDFHKVLAVDWIFLVLDLLSDACLLRLILFEIVKIGHVHSSCWYFPSKDEDRELLLYTIIMVTMGGEHDFRVLKPLGFVLDEV